MNGLVLRELLDEGKYSAEEQETSPQPAAALPDVPEASLLRRQLAEVADEVQQVSDQEAPLPPPRWRAALKEERPFEDWGPWRTGWSMPAKSNLVSHPSKRLAIARLAQNHGLGPEEVPAVLGVPPALGGGTPSTAGTSSGSRPWFCASIAITLACPCRRAS